LEVEGNDIHSEKDVIQNYNYLFESKDKDIISLNSLNMFPVTLFDLVKNNNIMIIFLCDKWGSIYIKRLIRNSENEDSVDFIKEMILKFKFF
jgi:hypothetical protein